MCTARSLPYKGVSVQEVGSLSRGSLSGRPLLDGDPLPPLSPVDRMTDTTKNISLPQTSFPAVKRWLPLVAA